MSAQYTTINWIRVGLFALPISGVLIAWSSLDPQPDQNKDPEAWARFVGSTYYLLTHVFGSMGSALLAIFGVFALGAYLANSRAGRLGLVAMVITVVGQALSLVIGGVSTFALNAIVGALRAGHPAAGCGQRASGSGRLALRDTAKVGGSHLGGSGPYVLRAGCCARDGYYR
jgi:signal transduction histidine kinase